MYVIIWKFQAKAGCEDDFERAYGPDGEWVQLFNRGDGYLSTELLHEEDRKGHYFTIDRWQSPTAYEAFRDRWRSQFDALDQRCESLTEEETKIGTFLSPASGR
jgi:heme-degrading monooxygenase HmoA